MRATIARMPRPLRLAMGLLTIALLAFFGFTFRESEAQKVLGYLLIALAAVRSLLWLREVSLWLSAAGVESGDQLDSSGESSVSSSPVVSPASGTSTRPDPTK